MADLIELAEQLVAIESWVPLERCLARLEATLRRSYAGEMRLLADVAGLRQEMAEGGVSDPTAFRLRLRRVFSG